MYTDAMKNEKYTYWKDGEFWLGYLEEFPNYISQGETLEELQENLRDIYADLTSGAIPSPRHTGELQVA